MTPVSGDGAEPGPSIFDLDEEAVALYDRLCAFAARIEWLTGWKPQTASDVLAIPDAPPEAVRLMEEWRELKRAHTARLAQIDRARLSRFQRGEFDSEEEARQAQLWWLRRY